MTRPSTLVFHPFVLALYPILLVYSRNTDLIYFDETFGALIVVSLTTLSIYAVIRQLWSDPVRAGLFTSALLFVVFSFERNVHTLQVRGWITSPTAREWLILATGLISLGAWWLFLRFVPRAMRPLNTMANAASLALVAFLAPGLISAARPTALPHSTPVSDRGEEPDARQPARQPAGQDPDIYFIVLDAYGRSDILKSLLGWDNEAFLDRMIRRGFYLARQSTSNYCQTALSVSATLSGRYHDAMMGSRSRSRLPLRDLVRDNAWLATLRERNYQLVSFASGFGLTDGFPADHRWAPSPELSEFNALLLDLTPVWTLLNQGAGQAAHRRHRARIDYLFDHLADVAADPRPTFCLAHVLAPHPPFVFSHEGGDRSAENTSYRLTDGTLWSEIDGHGGAEDYAAHYRDQASYITDRVEAAVDAILARSPAPPVIIIQGDHGPGSHFDTDNAEPNDLAERMSILNLCLIPGIDPAQLVPTMTPVNTFRIVSDWCFGTNLGRLPDRNYYSSYQSPYVFIDVTGRINPQPPLATANVP